jgi:hypothetical protein
LKYWLEEEGDRSPFIVANRTMLEDVDELTVQSIEVLKRGCDDLLADIKLELQAMINAKDHDAVELALRPRLKACHEEIKQRYSEYEEDLADLLRRYE